jgi:hypothetical protein
VKVGIIDHFGNDLVRVRGLRLKISGCETLIILKCGGFHMSYGMLKPKSVGYRDPSVWWSLNEFSDSEKD